MNRKQAVFEDLRKLTAQFRGLYEAAEELGRIGSIEQASVEAQDKLDQLRAQDAEIQRQWELQQQELDARLAAKTAANDAEIIRKLAIADRDAASRRDAAATEAEKIIAAAKAEALKVANTAAEQARAFADDASKHRAQLDEAKKKLGAFAAEIEMKQQEYDALADKVDALAVKRAEILAHIEALKAKF